MLTAIHPLRLQPGQLVDGWRVVALLGAGTYGAVYRVEKNGQHFALKLAMHRDGSGDAEQAARRLKRELGCLTHLGHRNIVDLHAHGRWPDPRTGWRYLVLDFVEGYTLEEWVARMHPTAQEVVGVFSRLAAALAHMHERGVFHRDLKLANIMVRASDGEPFILDFSAGDYTHAAELTDAPLPPGTRRYRSPEAARFLRKHGEEHGARYEFKVTDDVYALGVCLYDVLTAPQSMSDEPRVRVEGSVMPPSPRELNPRVPATLSDVALGFIARRPDQRPPTAEVMRRQLEALPQQDMAWAVPLHTSLVRPRLAPATGTGGAPPWRAHRRGATATLAVALVLAAVALAQAWLRPAPPSAPAQANRGVAAPAHDAGAVASTERAPPGAFAAPGVASDDGGPPLASVAPSPGVASPPPAPIQKETPAVKRAPIADSPADAPSRLARPPVAGAGWTEFLKKCAAASAAVALQLGCPGTQLRPEPGACPTETRRVMFEVVGIRRNDSFSVFIDSSQPQGYDEDGVWQDHGTYAAGPVRGVVVGGFREFPEGTVLSGQLWTPGVALYVRYTEAELPNGRKYPVCIAIGDDGPQPAGKGPRPGTVRFSRTYPAYVVERWP